MRFEGNPTPPAAPPLSLSISFSIRALTLSPARFTAPTLSLKRLQALSAEQDRDVAQMEASLDALRRAAPTNVPKAAAASRGDWTEHHATQHSKSQVPAPTSGDTNSVDGSSRRFGSEGVESRVAGSTADALPPQAAAASLSSPSSIVEREVEQPARGVAATAAAATGAEEVAASRGGSRGSASPKRDMRTEWEVRVVVLA